MSAQHLLRVDLLALTSTAFNRDAKVLARAKRPRLSLRARWAEPMLKFTRGVEKGPSDSPLRSAGLYAAVEYQLQRHLHGTSPRAVVGPTHRDNVLRPSRAPQ